MERQTRQQRAVMQAISGSGRSLNPQEVLVLAQQVVPSINLSTVYRQLKNLQAQGHVVRVQLPGQATRFEAAHLTPLAARPGHRVIRLNSGAGLWPTTTTSIAWPASRSFLCMRVRVAWRNWCPVVTRCSATT
jgi:Ferric uptake regulator family